LWEISKVSNYYWLPSEIEDWAYTEYAEFWLYQEYLTNNHKRETAMAKARG